MSLLVNGKSTVDGAEVPLAVDASGNLVLSTSTAPVTKTVTTLLNAVTTNQTSSVHAFGAGRRWLQASIAGTGAVSATVTWYGTNTNAASGGVVLATMSLSGTTTDTAGADIAAEPAYMYCILTNISGTSAAVTAKASV